MPPQIPVAPIQDTSTPTYRKLSAASKYHRDHLLPVDHRIKGRIHLIRALAQLDNSQTKEVQEEAYNTLVMASSSIDGVQDTPASSNQVLYTLFKKFPREIQDQIWQWHVRFKPRKVEVRTKRFGYRWEFDSKGRLPPICHITGTYNKKFLNMLGYVELKHISNSKNGIWFHPEIDLLHINLRNFIHGNGTKSLAGLHSLIDALIKCGAPRRLCSIAIHAEPIYDIEGIDESIMTTDLCDELLAHLRDYENLELVLIILNASQSSGWGCRLSGNQAELNMEEEFEYQLRENEFDDNRRLKETVELYQKGKPNPTVKLVYPISRIRRCIREELDTLENKFLPEK